MDVEIRKKLRQELKSLKEKLSIPIIHVTHDLSEALFLGDDILPVVRGRIDRSWLQPHVAALFDDEIYARRWRSAS